jgi:subtilisin family serine protease
MAHILLSEIVCGVINMDNNCTNKVISEDYADFILDYEATTNDLQVNSMSCYIRINDYFSSVYVPLQQVPADVLNVYGYKVFVRLFGLMDTASLEASGINRLRNISGLGYGGQGVLVGFVDTGIDYTHKAFQYADGTTKIVSIWDQSIQSGNYPEGLFYGTEYTREQINNALKSTEPRAIVPSMDEIGHGTFLAGTAAGTLDNANNFSGTAPYAEIVVVKLKPAKQNLREAYLIPQDAICYQENDIMLGIKYLLETAEKYNRPIVICIGLGNSQGSHDPGGSLSTYLTAVTQIDGVAVVIAAGNEGNSRHHYEKILNNGVDSDTVELNVAPNEPGFVMEIWGDIPNIFSVELITPGGEYVPRIYPRLGEKRDVSFIFESTVISIYFKLVGSQSGAQLVSIKFLNPSEGIWRIIINKVQRNLSLRINMWLPITDFLNELTYFINSNPYNTLTTPGNTIYPIVVTAYDYSNKSLYQNASRGYNRVGQIIPNLGAPGVNIIGPTFNNGYTTKSGTSIAAAHTAGVVAILLEWGKIRGNAEYINGVDIKNLLLRGAEREPNLTYPNREWGYGILNIFGALESLRGIL